MDIDRRSFVGAVAAAGIGGRAREAGALRAPSAAAQGRFDPWVEVEPAALDHNVDVVSRLTGGRPILAVIKNNAYGLGLREGSRLLEAHDPIAGFAVVKPEDALALRDAGIRKTVLLMGMAPDELVPDLVARGVHLSFYLDDDATRLPGLVPPGEPIHGHVYVDTGMSRMGMPYHRALAWLERLAARSAIRIDGMFTALTERPDFDPEQLRRFLELAESARASGVAPGRLHAASSNGVYHLPDAHLDLVRPGIALFGGYPSRPDEERAKAELVPAVRLRCRVVRVERLRPGDTVNYSRNYRADRPTWVATLPAGHVSGVLRGAAGNARVLIGDRTYPVIGGVTASHMILEIGDERTVDIGDVATLVGPDHPDVHPNELARVSNGSVYDVFMHLNPSLPRIVL